MIGLMTVMRNLMSDAARGPHASRLLAITSQENIPRLSHDPRPPVSCTVEPASCDQQVGGAIKINSLVCATNPA